MSEITITQPWDMATQPWDMAGADGLVAARALFGEAVDHLAPFQSMETELEGVPCAVLRLGDRNFRITYPGPLDHRVAPLRLHLWVKRLDWMGALVRPNPSSTMALAAESLSAIAAQTTVRAPHRLHSLPLHCAVPAHVATFPVLIWHHPLGDRPGLEIHLAHRHIEKFCRLIPAFRGRSVSLTTASS